MSIAASVKHISPVARALTEGSRLATLKSTYAPVTEVARSLQVPVKPNGVAYCERVALESEDTLTKANEIMVGADAAAVEDQVGELTKQVNKMVFTARNVIVPTVDNLVNAYAARITTAVQPNVSVNVFKYNDVHNAPALVNHLMSKYAQIQAFSEYRTFILSTPTAESIITLVSENNPHLDQQQVVEWLLELGAERILSVWQVLFGTSRNFEPHSVSFMRPTNLPKQVDELLLAYCMAGALRDAPMDAMGESVALPEWEKHMDILHELLGNRLLKAYEYRANDVKHGRLVLESDGRDAMRTGVVSVLVNGDVYNGWLSEGGDVEALLAVAVYEPNLKTISAINAESAQLVERWSRYYPVLRETVLANAKRTRRATVVEVFKDNSLLTVEGLPQLDSTTAQAHLAGELRAIKDEAFDNPFQLFADLVCRVYYRDQPLYIEFLHALERYSKVHPEATGRELAIEAVIEMVASWLASQIDTVKFKPVVIPGAVLATEDINVNIEADHESVAEDVGEVDEDEEINEVVEAELEETDSDTAEDPEATSTPETTPESDEDPTETEATELETEDEVVDAEADVTEDEVAEPETDAESETEEPTATEAGDSEETEDESVTA